MRLGFAVKILGDQSLKSNDARRWQSGPHLRVSIGYLHAILDYLDRIDVRMYRISSDLAPYVTHPEMPRFHSQIDECIDGLAEVGARARDLDIRLSFHPSQYIVLNSLDERVASLAVEDFKAECRILDAMGQGAEAVVVTHVGGVYGDHQGSMDRFASRYEALPVMVKRRLVLENDETSYSASDVLSISARVGVPVVFDYLHHMNNNPDRLPIRDMLNRALATWPEGVTPKIHFSSPRTELREQKRKNPDTGKAETVYLPPLMSQHSDYINPYEFSMFLDTTHGLPDFDVMLEAKAKDLAVLGLRKELRKTGLG